MGATSLSREGLSKGNTILAKFHLPFLLNLDFFRRSQQHKQPADEHVGLLVAEPVRAAADEGRPWAVLGRRQEQQPGAQKHPRAVEGALDGRLPEPAGQASDAGRRSLVPAAQTRPAPSRGLLLVPQAAVRGGPAQPKKQNANVSCFSESGKNAF
jgi:hypothetical protein